LLEMLTILHLIPTLEGGGAERQLSMLVTEQARRGLDVHVAVRRGGVHAPGLQGVRLHELGNWPSVNPRLFFAIRRVLKDTKPQIVQTWLPQMDILGGIAAVQRRAAWVISERTSEEYYAQVPLIAWLRLSLGRFASAIVANSIGGESYWQRATRRSARLAVIRNAVDFDLVRNAGLQSPSGFRRPLLLAVGRFTPEKALEVLVRSMKCLSGQQSANVVMIGEGPARSAIEAEIAAASLEERITILPYQPDWWRWLKVADGLISMSRFEGNPNVVLEAMAGGCPVILSDISAHREIADKSTAVFVPVDDVRSLSASIAELITNREEALRRAACASAQVRSMTVKAMVDAYDSIYHGVLNRKK
jgi:glycosyltransferase involved in cell wall biosynthesis